MLPLLLALLAAPAVAGSPTPAAEAPVQDPMLAPWTGPHGGLPPFDKVVVADFPAAFEAAIAELYAEVDAIATQKPKPTFDNTIRKMEEAGDTYSRVARLFEVYASTESTPELQEIEVALAPKRAAVWSTITSNAALFARIEAVATSKKFGRLTPEQQRLTKRVYRDFVRAGAKLDPEKKARVAAINGELATLSTTFSQHLLADEETTVTLAEGDLGGLPDWYVAGAKAAAEDRGVEGWIVPNTRSAVDPFLTYSARRDLREAVWRRFTDRGDNGGDTDNNAIITKILALRAERAALLGYETYAHWRLEDTMAGTPDKAVALMESVWPAAVARVREEVADQLEIARADGVEAIEPWDYRYYQEKVRKARYDLDQEAVKPYLQLEKLREAMFWAAGQLYGLEFTLVEGVPTVDPNIRVYAVTRDGQPDGLWYFDPYARPGKQSGAWMSEYRTQHKLHGLTTPIVSNNSNFVPGAPGEPVLISWDDAETLFHEFGHAIHGLLSDVTYPTLAGTSVASDYVEFPSQLNEHWLSTPEVLSRFCVHVETGEPIPQELVDKIEKASTFGQGFGTVEYLASAIVDMRMHLAGATPIDPDAFERETLAAIGMPREIVMRHRTPQFGHVFSGEGYAAGYYSYLWADTLTADAAEAFEEAGSMYDPETAKRLRTYVLSVGDTIDPADGFRQFRGRDVDATALMRDRGFPVTK